MQEGDIFEVREKGIYLCTGFDDVKLYGMKVNSGKSKEKQFDFNVITKVWKK